jgi:hypothetical protein
MLIDHPYAAGSWAEYIDTRSSRVCSVFAILQ